MNGLKLLEINVVVSCSGFSYRIISVCLIIDFISSNAKP
jgi:hypothetical protein